MEIFETKRGPVTIRKISPEDDLGMAALVRYNLKSYGLDIPGTAYFDEALASLHAFYDKKPEQRVYYTLHGEDGTLLGGGGLAEFPGIPNCAEVQKFYLADEAKGLGLGHRLLELVERFTREHGYDKLYLETHSNLTAAVRLYTRYGFTEIEKPAGVMHGAMNLFYIKPLELT